MTTATGYSSASGAPTAASLASVGSGNGQRATGWEQTGTQSVSPRPAAQLPQRAAETTAQNPWPVSVLSEKFYGAVERWPAAWVTGQITQINTRRAGSAYITLRDDFEDIAMEVNGFGRFAAAASQFVQGDRVVIHGKANLWMKRTSLSLRGDTILKVGSGGSLKAMIDELRKRLKGEGLFDQEHKLSLPEFPKTIGLICAPQARAEGDVITNVNLRWPTVTFKVAHVHVQGEQCPGEVVQAIKQLDADTDVDVIIVARGGGSFEDLIGFSDEQVVRAAYACATPLVSAIGHEDDWTLLDLVADLRASTPTDAAKRVVPDVNEQSQLIEGAIDRMRLRVRSRVENEIRLVEGYANRPSLTQPHTMIEPHQRVIDDALQRLDIGLRRIVDDAQLTIEKAHASLTALSPQSTLDRGYAVVQSSDGHVLDDASQVNAGDNITVTLKKGVITATTTSATV
ncbi:exodeoxyribonuclease VII large subunit [Bifidobacterium scaligerum]|uniref:Exodeoxyribonuclease 7 large subunit n=1 Tax=Bifidobacterium scaligerum TaxID=2052656 RepID=A0A2M9HQ21_9BIFI|nr:exodeoxyribonuclease VII large subunit [Bifidobacterium scaligerum]PJM78871.1 exodeoxyribonuclease VII large subunit [Bifidobacterium scaligerum]